ncbi:hypothetical protein L3Y34_000154 [Caenorhabditis briggsae]|uniref:T-box domain-containing protein n=1 Tax=Caenorhabditis briggsae TaxID=6238 RepID=A0AAE9D8L4_CAEBR|nr:hypothetical protein L3Y34_000154 [Caenorhabditis briggsae]
MMHTQIHVALMEKALWKEFDDHRNEMIITKIGRNLFPILEFAFKGLIEHQMYRIGITMEPTIFQKLKFTAGRWEKLDILEDLIPTNEVFFVKSGRELLHRGLKLEKLKLTNSKDAVQKNDQMIRVQSMRQYIPILNIYEDLPNGAHMQIGKYKFTETKFIAVTAYQSEKVKNLKVQKNKFAQGFREGVKSVQPPAKRPPSTTSSQSSPDSTLSSESSSDGQITGLRRIHNMILAITTITLMGINGSFELITASFNNKYVHLKLTRLKNR